MKILLLIFHGLSASNGISKKILAQLNAFKRLGLEAHLAHYEVAEDGYRSWMIDENILEGFGNNSSAKIKKRIDYSAITRYTQENQISFVYMRSCHNANPFTIRLIKTFKEAGCRVVMEIPTFPYDQEYITLGTKKNLLVDQLFRHSLAKQLDGIVTFTSEKKIFGKRTIQISNGIDFDAIPLRNKKTRIDDDPIHLLGVAEIHYWHGFDRVIAGLAEYYKTNPKRKVYFHLVGKLTAKREIDEILPLITKNKLEEYVLLHGAMYGKDLDDIFDMADFGIGSLGRHRSGITHIRTLKNREYAARGIAFVYSETDVDFDDKPYVLKVPADESVVSIPEIINFIDHNKISPQKIRDSIQQLSWKNQMQKVIKEAYEK